MTTDWNDLVPAENRYLTSNQGSRPAAFSIPTHIVIHITGTDDFEPVRQRFQSPNGRASAHYVILQDGGLTQFVPDGLEAWHAGTGRLVRGLYDEKGDHWKKFLRYFSWYNGYPDDAVYLDAHLNETAKNSAKLVARPDGADWSDYGYFEQRWGNRAKPKGWEISRSPNDYSIGIECVSYGARVHNDATYPDALYGSLNLLLDDLCAKYGIARTINFVLGHEDVNPVDRFGWDPNRGFDWGRIGVN